MKYVTTFTLTASLLFGAAGAQNLTAYKSLASSLDAAAQSSSGTDPLKTLSNLDQAEKALDQLAPTLTNAKLSGGLRDTLSAARAAQGRTPTELQAQVQLARGLMRKALYDQTVTVLASSPANGLERLGVLANEVGADAAALQADAKAGKLNLVTWRLQKAATAKLSAALNSVQAQQTAQSYLNLARATGWFTVVQETGRAQNPPLDVPQFEKALRELTTGDTAALSTSLTSLRSGVGAMTRALATVPTATVVRPTTPPAEQPVVVTPNPANPQPAPHTTPPAVSRSEGGIGSAYAALSRALTAAGHADLPTAREQLSKVPTALATAPSELRSVPNYDAFLNHVQSMSERKGLRSSDVQALIGELGGLEAQAKGMPTSTLDSLASSASRGLGGPVRALLTLLMAIACAAPLYLLNLAFGGRNPYWRAISVALGLLLLPAFLEGTFGFLGWLGDLVNVPFLRSLTNLTLGQSAYGLPFKGLLYAAALGLSIYGFRGLCVQFGLLGSGAQPKSRVNTVKSPTQTSLDWDEEI